MASITRGYDTYSHAKRAVTELEAAGFSASDISIVANKHVSDQYADVEETSAAGSGAGIGAAVGGGAGLLAGLGMLAIPGIGPVVAAGWLASTALGVAAGAATGGLLGALVGEGVPERDAHVLAESVRRGGTMVTAKVSDEKSAMARAIMDRHSPIDPQDRDVQYQKDGWKNFDPAAKPYKPNESDINRMRRDYQ